MLERKPAVLRRLQFPHTTEAVDKEVCRRQRTNDIQESSTTLPICIPRLSIWRWMPTTGTGTSDPIDVELLRATAVFTRCVSPRLLQLIQSRFVFHFPHFFFCFFLPGIPSDQAIQICLPKVDGCVLMS